MKDLNAHVNPGRNATAPGGKYRWLRIPIRTPLIGAGDDILSVARTWALPKLEPGDLLFLSEKAVACSQGRAIPLEEIRPRPLARFLSGFVTKTPHGIGLGIPETMEMALRECGVPRILLAAAVGGLGRLLDVKGLFYRVAGRRAAAIDGPCPNTIPPYDRCVVLTPKEPDQVAQRVGKSLGCSVLIVDLNDLGGAILGSWPAGLDRAVLLEALAGNPLGQCWEQTPMGILRKL